MQKIRDRAFNMLGIAGLLPIVFWPLIFGFSFMVFDAPGSTENLYAWLFFITLNAYPLLLIANYIACRKLYKRFKRTAYALAIWPIVVFLILYLSLLY